MLREFKKLKGQIANIEDIINMKMDKNELKYPVEKAKGKSTKYTEL